MGSPRTDRTSFRRPLLWGAALLCLLFVAAGGVVAWLGTDRLTKTFAAERREQAEREARRRSVDDAVHAAAALLVRLDDARQAADDLVREAARAAPPPVAAEPPFEPLPGTARWWHRPAGADVVAIRAEGDGDPGGAALAAWTRRLGPVLRSAIDGRAGIVRASVAIDGLGVVAAPPSWAERAAGETWAALQIENALDASAAPLAAAWLNDRHGRISYVVPVPGAGGARRGSVTVEVDPTVFRADLDDAARAALASFALLAADGAPLAASAGFDTAIGVNGALPREDALRPYLGGDGVFYPSPLGHHVVARSRRFAAAGVFGTPFSVACVRPVLEGAAGQTQTTLAARRLGLAVLGLSVLFGFATLLGATHLARLHQARMNVVLAGIDAHESGDYAHGVGVGGQDETAEVARWMNTAAVRLRHAQTRVEETARRLDSLIDAMGDGFVTTDADDRIVQVNQRFADLLRRPPASLVGRYVEELILPESIDRYRAQQKRLRERRPTRVEVVWNAAKAPHPRTELNCVPLFDDEGRLSGGWIVVTDLTDKVRVHEEIARAEKLRALGEMAGGVAHDFNNVLTVILGNSQYLMLEDLPADMKETLATIERAALEGTETVRRIREFTRSRTVSVDAAAFSADDVVEDVMTEARRRFEAEGKARGVEYKVEVRRLSRRRVRGNRTEMREALANVVENALDAMPRGGTLTVETFDRGEDAVAVRVEDTGVGMTPEVQKKIFDPFFTTKQSGRCPGLGLSIAFGIVRAHRGRIDVKSEPGAGSTITIVLPAATARGDGAADTGSQGGSTGARVEPRVLLVGGGPGEMDAVLDELRGLGIYVASVHPASAHALVSDSGIFNTLVVEHDLGTTTGWELARQARAAREDLRIVLLTTPANPVSETQARNAGIDRVLVRPFDARDLHAEVYALLAAPRERAEPPAPASVRARQQPARPREDEMVETSEIWREGEIRAAPASPGDGSPGDSASGVVLPELLEANPDTPVLPTTEE